MIAGAPRPGLRLLRLACAWLVLPILGGAASADVLAARYGEPTTRYAHGVLGDAVEYGALLMDVATCDDCVFRKTVTFKVTLPETRVFEDIEPRVLDVTGDGRGEVVVVETDMGRGASLAVYNQNGKIASTPFIGRTHRWLAPLGAADLDGDGFVELAYVDRPHLAKTLRIWRYRDGKLQPVADKPGLTNHRIGQDFISGGIRTCSGGPEIVTANGNWSRVMISRLEGGRIESRDAGPFNGPKSLTDALTCLK